MLKNYKSKHCFNDNFWVILIVSWLLICKLWLADCWFSELIASWLLAGHTWFVKVSRPSPRPQVPRPQHSLKVYSWQRQEAISWLLVANYNAFDTYARASRISNKGWAVNKYEAQCCMASCMEWHLYDWLYLEEGRACIPVGLEA